MKFAFFCFSCSVALVNFTWINRVIFNVCKDTASLRKKRRTGTTDPRGKCCRQLRHHLRNLIAVNTFIVRTAWLAQPIYMWQNMAEVYVLYYKHDIWHTLRVHIYKNKWIWGHLRFRPGRLWQLFSRWAPMTYFLISKDLRNAEQSLWF